MPDLFEPMTFARGRSMPNRLMLAPLTNQQSHPDGTLSEEEFTWLVMRARGGFGLVMTAAAFVDPVGKGFPGQLGIHDDICVPALADLATAIKAEGSLAAVQLYHAGYRADTNETGCERVGPSDDEYSGARAMTLAEIESMIEAFVAAAQRAERAGFDGVELHGAHTYLLCEFLSSEFNRRTDRYGGSLENRARLVREIVSGIRRHCRSDFTLGIRLSGEVMGMKTGEMRQLVAELMAEGRLDYIDMSLFDSFKQPEEAEFAGRPLIGWFTDIERHGTRLGVAGKVRSRAAGQACLDAGADFVLVGQAAIANHDFPKRIRGQSRFEMPATPIARAHLVAEGVSPAFLDYLGTFPDFVEPA